MTLKEEDFFFDRPQTGNRVAVGRRILPNERDRWFSEKPKIGLVISTYGAPAYVELGLAVRKHFYPSVPALVHDDASPQGEALAAICDRYGATFQTNSSSLGHEMGDLSGIVGGLKWARAQGIELLAKMSRRFVPTTDWTAGLAQISTTTQYPTFGRNCQNYALPLRTECFAMAVDAWSDASVIDDMTSFMLRNRISILIEHYVVGRAQRAYELNCQAAQQWERQNVRVTPRPTIVNWDLLGAGRRTKAQGHLWHETAPPEEYAGLAATLGLKLEAQNFIGYNSQAGV